MIPATTPDLSALDASVFTLAPDAGDARFTEFLERASAATAEPFAEARVQAVAALSTGLLRDPLLRADPASVAVGFWLRAAHLARLRATFEARRAAEPSVVRAPVGRVLHIAPANVDTLFLYSWALSWLCGNVNVVRLTQDRTPAVDAILRVISEISASEPELALTNRFVTYAHDESITTLLSAWCSHRILWGGDETIAALRPLPLNPHASERVFGSKFSYGVFSTERYRSAPEAERDRLATAFFNDLFWFDQMACSSPHVLFWVGSPEDFESAVPEFEARLQREVDRKSHATPASLAVRRLTHAFELAADREVQVELRHPGFVGVRFRDARQLDRQICGGGFLQHARLERLEELASFAREVDQTVTYFGFDRERLMSLATRIGARGVDRIVPVGEALTFHFVWDGFDLLDDLTRKVTVLAP